MRSGAGAIRVALWASVVSLLGIVPHLIEDAGAGVPERFDVTPGQFAGAMGVVLAVQVATLLAAQVGDRRALGALALFGLGWVLAAVLDHPGAFTSGAFRESLSSRLWVWLIAGGQGVVAGAAALALRDRRPRESQRSTGSAR